MAEQQKKTDNRNADLDEGLGGRMFSGIVTADQDRHRAEVERANQNPR